MKTDIHPDYVEATVRCSCGNTFTTRSTKAEIHVELCNECHPFFTGKQKLVDSGGRVERFQRRYAADGRKKKPAPPPRAERRVGPGDRRRSGAAGVTARGDGRVTLPSPRAQRPPEGPPGRLSASTSRS